MNYGKTIFAQLMDFLPVHEFRQCVERYQGHYKIKSFAANFRRLQRRIMGVFIPLGSVVAWSQVSLPFNLPQLFFTFLKIGAVLYGSGYVLLAFLRADFVARFGWLTDQQLIDVIAIEQVTPGPVFTTATFIGYVLGGLPGALLAILGIFLPSFIFVAITNPLIPRMRKSAWVSGLLDGMNVASLGLMVGVTWQLGRASFTSFPPIIIALGSFILLMWFRVNSTWLIAGGGLIGLLSAVLRWVVFSETLFIRLLPSGN